MLKMYVGYPSEEMERIAVLIFAHDSKEAFKLAYKSLDCEFIYTRVNRLWKNAPHLLAAADKEKYSNDVAHVIDNPPSCENCEVWAEYVIVEQGEDLCADCIRDEEHQMTMHGGKGY